MKYQVFHLLIAVCVIAFISCQKAELSVPQTELAFTKEGGTQTVRFSTNKSWVASVSASWIKLNQSSGESNASYITVIADANTDYDYRTATITIKVEGLMRTINVKQATNTGIILSKNTYDLTCVAQTFEVELKTNVDYSVSIDGKCKEWLSLKDTKALSTSKLTFEVAENETNDNREGRIIIHEKYGSLSETITVKQSQVNGL